MFPSEEKSEKQEEATGEPKAIAEAGIEIGDFEESARWEEIDLQVVVLINGPEPGAAVDPAPPSVGGAGGNFDGRGRVGEGDKNGVSRIGDGAWRGRVGCRINEGRCVGVLEDDAVGL